MSRLENRSGSGLVEAMPPAVNVSLSQRDGVRKSLGLNGQGVSVDDQWRIAY